MGGAFTSYILDMKNILESIDQRNIELGKMLFSLRQSIDLDRILGLNADSINNGGIGKKFFVHIQMLLIESIAINICKIFEPAKKHDLNSIPAILKFIKLNRVTSRCSKPIDEFILKHKRSNTNKGSDVEMLEDICLNFYTKHKISFDKYDYARNKIFAHAEFQAQKKFLPSHQGMEEILEFGTDFYCMINKAFIDAEPHPIYTDKQASSSLCRLFERIGFKDIKPNLMNKLFDNLL